MHKLLLLLIALSFVKSNAIAQELYDIDNITVIELTFDDPNWDQTMDTHYANDLDERLLASCSVNGVPFDSVGVKFKGNSTYDPNNAKNPLNIKLNHIIGSQDYDGWYTLKLSNGDRDPSFVREALSYEILRKYMMAPLSNFTKVYVNGDYYGLFTSNESINKKFIEDYFYSDRDNVLIKGNPEIVMNGGSTLEYLGVDTTSYFDFYEMKSDYGWNDLVNFADKLNSGFSDAETFLDIDRAIWMLAFNNVVVNLDSYTGPFTQNYYLLKDDNDRMNAIVWDLNMSLGGFRLINLGGGPGNAPTVQDLQQMDPLLRLGNDNYPLIDKILSTPRYQKMYIAHCRTMLEENFVNDLYFERAETMQALVYDDYDSDPGQFFSTTDFSNNLTTTIQGSGGPGGGSFIGLSELMDGRVAFLQAHTEFQKTPPTINSNSTSTVLPNTTVDITANVENSNYVHLGYRHSITEPFSKIEMFDDGAHNDGVPDDGIYGASIQVGASDIQYYFYAENDEAGMFLPKRAEHEYFELAVAGDVVINEFLASNSSIQVDQDGEFDDWIELYNNSSNSLDLSGYFLSDDASDQFKWSFPDGSIINANDFLIVWSDDDINQEGLHTNFKLSSSGEALYLSNNTGSLIDEIVFPIQETNVSHGRYPNGIGPFTSMSPTYNAENSITTGVSESEILEHVIIYPNPVHDYFVIDFETKSELKITIFNALGETIYQKSLLNKHEVNTANWPAGMYFVKVGNLTQKILVQG